ncbi:MAG: hypothetical protein ACE5FI_07860 [Anaerolineales bacterium]
MEAEKILEGLTQEERLELLERLIQGAAQAREESLSTEERVERLEESLWGGGPGRARRGRRFSGAPGWAGWNGCQCGCR